MQWNLRYSRNSIKKRFDSEPVCNVKYLKTKENIMKVK